MYRKIIFQFFFKNIYWWCHTSFNARHSLRVYVSWPKVTSRHNLHNQLKSDFIYLPMNNLPFIYLPIINIPIIYLPIINIPIIYLHKINLLITKLPLNNLPIICLPIIYPLMICLPIIRLPIVCLPIIFLPILYLPIGIFLRMCNLPFYNQPTYNLPTYNLHTIVNCPLGFSIYTPVIMCLARRSFTP